MTYDRKNIDEKYKWNLKEIYKNWEEWDEDLNKLIKYTEELKLYYGKLKKDKSFFIEFSQKNEIALRLIEKLYIYPYMLKDLDSKDEESTIKMQTIEEVLANYSISMSWVESEILEIPQEIMQKWIEESDYLKQDKFNINELYRLKKHVLSHDKNELLSYYDQFMSMPSDIYNDLSISDIKFKEITLSTGEKVTVTNGVYSKILNTNRNQDDRKKAFEALYGSYNDTINTFASIYRAILYRNKGSFMATKFDSSLEKSLEKNNISISVYKSLLESAKNNVEPLRRYVNIRKKYLNLKEYHYYDNNINILDYNKTYTYDEAKELVLNSVKFLGNEYSQKLEKALSDGWLDVFETNNKRSGAYSISIYDVHPYMLLNYQETLSDVFTLAHELGHTMHSVLSNENQPFSTANYTIFVAEVASTFNERLLLDYMLEDSNNNKEKIFLLEQALANFVGTYYMQSLFADYEYKAHKLVENGEAVTADVLSNIMYNLFKEYFGDTIIIDDLQKIIWARIPHFYNSPFYVYQYATSFSASAKLYENIKKDKNNIELYLNLLKSGGNNHPMEQLKIAGVDLSKKESFDAIAKEFSRLLDIFEKELEIK